MKGSCTLLLLLLCGSAAAGSGGMWTPDCKRVSSGCSACSYVKPRGSSTTPRGLKQLPVTVADSASVPFPTTSSDLQLAPADSSGSSGGSSGSSSGELASSTSTQGGTVTAQHHSGGSSGISSGGGWSSDDLSWGGSGVWWTPGAVLTCTACDTSRGYKLVETNGTKHCACTARHGVVPGRRQNQNAAMSAAWANMYVKSFTCQTCGGNSVPFLPGSNLVVAYNGAKWSIRCESNSRGSSTLLAPPVVTKPGPGSLPGQPSTGSSSSIVTQQDAIVLESGAAQIAPDAATATAAAPARAAEDNAASAASAVESAHARRRREQSWYKRGRRKKHGHGGGGSSSGGSSGGSNGGSYIVAPWWPGQCIDCNVVGSKADPTGTYCMCGSGPQPPSSPSPPPPPRPPSPSPPPPPSGACVTCDTAGIEAEIRDYCPFDPVVGVVYLEDFCPWEDMGIDEQTFTTSPNVIDPVSGGGAMSCAMLLEKQGATISVLTSVTGTGLTCSPTSSQYSFVVPTTGPVSSPSPPMPPPPSPSPAPPQPPPSPAPTPACLTCTSETLAYYVQAMCGQDPTTLIPITDYCKPQGVATLDVTYTATPANILVDGDTLKCSVLVGIPGQAVSIAWTVTSETACMPKTGTFAFTVPTYASSPSPAPPAPPPSSPAPSGQCVTCVMKPVEDEITEMCSESLDNSFYFAEVNDDGITPPGSRCWWSDPAITYPLFKTEPDILYEENLELGDCAKAAQYKGKAVKVTITVDTENDSGVTCSPTVSTYTINIPNFPNPPP